MKVKTQVVCENCDGSGYVSSTDAAGYNREDECMVCAGTGYQEAWNEINWEEELVGIVAKHREELPLNHAVLYELTRLADRQQERIQRLEKIIVAMSNGLITTYPEAGEIHTHQIYPANGVRALVKEIKDSVAPSPAPLLDESGPAANQASKKAGESRLIGEGAEPDGARWRDWGPPPGPFQPEERSALAEEQGALAYQHMDAEVPPGAHTIEDMEYDAEMALHNGQLCDY